MIAVIAINLTLEDVAAVTVILTFLWGLALWVGSKVFATRGDLHKVNGTLQQVGLDLELTKNDVGWIKEHLEGKNHSHAK